MKNDLQSTILCTYEYTASILYIREHFAQSVCASQVASPTCTLLISLRIYYGCPFVLPIFVWWSLPASTLKTNKALSCGEKCKANSKAYDKPRWKTLRTYAMSCSRQVYTGQRCHEALHTSICACVLLRILYVQARCACVSRQVRTPQRRTANSDRISAAPLWLWADHNRAYSQNLHTLLNMHIPAV